MVSLFVNPLFGPIVDVHVSSIGGAMRIGFSKGTGGLGLSSWLGCSALRQDANLILTFL